MSLCCIHQHPNAGDRPWCTQCESLIAGTQIGDFTVVSYLGRGSFSVVYLAQQRTIHNRRVVMKVLLPVSERETLISFHREAQVLASLTHPYILPLYGYGVIEAPPPAHALDEDTTDKLNAREALASPYLVLPYAEQGSVDAAFERQGKQPWSLERVVPIIEDAAEALAYAHGRGVLHRDVKPANLLLFGEHVVLSDFGVACLIDVDTSHLTAPWAGSPAYMAPEVWTMVPGRYSDQYALAVTCFYLLTAKLPWGTEGKATNWAHQHRYVAPRSLREYRPDLPQTVSVVLQHALAKGPHDRYPDVKAFAADLRLAMHDNVRVSMTLPHPWTLPSPDKPSLPPNRIRISATPTQPQQVTRQPTSVLVASALIADKLRTSTPNPLEEAPTVVTESLMRKTPGSSEWHFERVHTTEILRRTAGNHWMLPALLLNAALCILLCALIASQSSVLAAAQFAISVLPSFILALLLAHFFRQSFTLSYSWGTLLGILFGTLDALLSALACYGWAALWLTLFPNLPSWQQFGSSYLQHATAIAYPAIMLGMLSIWPAVLGGLLIGIAAVRTERTRLIELDAGR
jgi:serine/threonine protein kinase